MSYKRLKGSDRRLTSDSNPTCFIESKIIYLLIMNYGLTDTDFLKIVGDHGEGFMDGTTPKPSPKRIGKMVQQVLDLLVSDPLITAEQIAIKIEVQGLSRLI